MMRELVKMAKNQRLNSNQMRKYFNVSQEKNNFANENNMQDTSQVSLYQEALVDIIGMHLYKV